MIPVWRLADGSHPEDWSPSHGDRPCNLCTGHAGHPLDGCPLLFAEVAEPCS